MAASLSLCGVATSQQADGTPAAGSNTYLNEQVQLGDVVAGQTLNVQQATTGASAVTTSVANAVSAGATNADLAFQSSQSASGAVAANTSVLVNGGGSQYLIGSTSATGNTATASTCCGTLSGTSTQNLTGPGVGATSDVYHGGYAATTSVDATALGNTQGWNTNSGVINATSNQSSSGGVSAVNTATVQATDSASYTATSVANDVEAYGASSPVTLTVNQSQSGVTQAIAANAQDYGEDAASTTSAVANNFNVYSDSYGNFIDATQANTGAVNVSNNQTVGTWYGTTATTGYGVGNSTVVANAGSYTQATTDQNNAGAITVNASLYGGSLGDGGAAYVSATGVGNAVSAYACAICNGTISAHNRQVNSGSVHAGAALTAQNVTTASGVASAVGNTASYDVVSSGSN